MELAVSIKAIGQHHRPIRDTFRQRLPTRETHMLGDEDKATDGVPEGRPVPTVEVRKVELSLEQSVQLVLTCD
ncbi:hypothetical protein GCM10010363_72170 [Streptomyces omiyaensis]|nr:hypothetical protein GCM10010363_72170 [Streptomyces omiyaensis]